MKFTVTILSIILVCSFVGAHSAYAVGYETYSAKDSPESETKTTGQSAQSLYKAFEKATFVEKFPAILDQVALFVQDVLGQFGLTDGKNR
jgi:hypothetical protein